MNFNNLAAEIGGVLRAGLCSLALIQLSFGATLAHAAENSSGDTRTLSNSGRSRTRRVAAIVSVTSTWRNSVTCGAVNALATMAAAMCLRTPRIGIL